MKQKHVDMLREVRLWTTQVITPAAVAILAIPELRNSLNETIKEIKRKHSVKKMKKEIYVVKEDKEES